MGQLGPSSRKLQARPRGTIAGGTLGARAFGRLLRAMRGAARDRCRMPALEKASEMQLHVRWKNLEVSVPVRTHAQQRVGLALDPFKHHVISARIDLAQVTGQRGVDKVCRIQVRGARMCEVIVTDTDVDVYVAIDRAADRASQCFAHVLERGTLPQESSPAPRRLLDAEVAHAD